VYGCDTEDALEPCDVSDRQLLASAPLRREALVTDAIVTTAKGLKAALASGASHIEITDHLDFTQHGEVLGHQGKNNTVLVIPETVKSIRVSSPDSLHETVAASSTSSRVAHSVCTFSDE
jgi:hypothetical protein